MNDVKNIATHLGVADEIVDVKGSGSVNLAKNGWMCGMPFDVVDIVC